MKNNTPLTLTDIAKLANVSESTVSRALNNNNLVSKKTRERIQAIAQEHGFKINSAARNLRLQKTNTIAVVILFDQKSGQSISDPFLLEILGTIGDELTKHGYDLLLTTSKTAHTDWYHYFFNSKRADGLIVIGQGEHDQRIAELAKAEVPFVVWGAKSNQNHYVTVGSDNRMGGYLATQHLLNHGCKKIAFFGDIHHNEIEDRWRGYQDALEEANLIADKSLQVSCDFTSLSGYNNLKDLLLINNNQIDGIFAVSDAIALGAIKFLSEKQIRIPKDIAIVGFDDITHAHFSTPSLTTIKQNISAGGKLLVDLLLKQLQKQKVQSQLLDVELIHRESA